MPPPPIRGGAKLGRFFRTVKQAQSRSVRGVDTGWFATAKYPDGTPVAAVAAWNEFGTERGGQQHTPERPAIRQAVAAAGDDIVAAIAESIDPKTMVFDERTAARAGTVLKGHIQRRITTLRDPPNAPSTIARKGSSNPLIDTGVLRSHVTYRVDP